MVVVRAWGTTGADIEHAVYMAQRGQWRRAWHVADVQRFAESACPIDVDDPKAIATDRGEHWAYAVYSARAQL
jgi:hypothetical protein